MGQGVISGMEGALHGRIAIKLSPEEKFILTHLFLKLQDEHGYLGDIFLVLDLGRYSKYTYP